jgi:hypothetical protein
LEYELPVGSLTHNERNNICSLSFPDSHCAILGDSQFCFRVRLDSNRSSLLGDVNTSIGANQGEIGVLSSFVDEQALLFGYVFFRQKRDDTNARGYFQKSVVVLTALPCLALFQKSNLCSPVAALPYAYMNMYSGGDHRL